MGSVSRRKGAERRSTHRPQVRRVIRARWPARNGHGPRLEIPWDNVTARRAAKCAQMSGWLGRAVKEKKEAVATPSTTQELEALELARSRLETVLAGDENWRALRQSGADDADLQGRAARQARNTRLEMALAGNAHYQAWKHLNGAIAALRARTAGQASQLDDGAQPLPEAPARPGGAAHAPVASAGPAGPQRLAERLGQLEGPQFAAIAPPEEAARRGALAAKGRRGSRVRADAPEASVTFVVREVQSPPGAAPADTTAEHIGGRLERLRSLEAREATERSHAAGVSDAEAEVTIVSAEGRRQQRRAEEEAGHVRRFRRAL